MREAILKVLPNLDSATLEKILDHLSELGVRSVKDLCYLVEEDCKPVLLPIHVRLLQRAAETDVGDSGSNTEMAHDGRRAGVPAGAWNISRDLEADLSSRRKRQAEQQPDAPAAKIFVGDHCPKTMQLLKIDQRYCDATIEAGGEVFNIHKSIFGIHSEFFNNAFTVEMKEKRDDAVKVQGVSAEVMKNVVDFLYSGVITTTRDNVLEIFIAADFLMIESLKTQSVRTMIECIDRQNCIDYWRFAKKFDFKELIDESSNFLASNLNSISESKQFMAVSVEELEEFVRCSCDKRKTHNIVVLAIFKWVKHDDGSREEKFASLFGMLDFGKFSKDLFKRLLMEPLVTRCSALHGKVVAELVNRVDNLTYENHKLTKEVSFLKNGRKQFWHVVQKNQVDEGFDSTLRFSVE